MEPAQSQLSATIDALEESESRTRAVFDAMQEGMLLTNADGDVISWNPSALRILGVTGGDPATAMHTIGVTSDMG